MPPCKLSSFRTNTEHISAAGGLSSTQPVITISGGRSQGALPYLVVCDHIRHVIPYKGIRCFLIREDVGSAVQFVELACHTLLIACYSVLKIRVLNKRRDALRRMFTWELTLRSVADCVQREHDTGLFLTSMAT